MKKISFSKTYYVSNKDLNLGDEAPGHQVIVVKLSKDKKRAKVKTITSLESPTKNGEKRKFKSSKRDLVSDLYNGVIIAIPKKYLDTPKLSGVFTKGIWVKRDKLKPNKYNTKVPRIVRKLIGK